eukprot:g31736.t1
MNNAKKRKVRPDEGVRGRRMNLTYFVLIFLMQFLWQINTFIQMGIKHWGKKSGKKIQDHILSSDLILKAQSISNKIAELEQYNEGYLIVKPIRYRAILDLILGNDIGLISNIMTRNSENKIVTLLDKFWKPDAWFVVVLTLVSAMAAVALALLLRKCPS